jgi:multidrug efflux system outer membrane protein
MRRSPGLMLAMMGLLAGCSLQRDYRTPTLAGAMPWSVPQAANGSASPGQWWLVLGDPAIDALIDSSVRDNPTLAQAVAKMDEARANVTVNRADELPSLTATASGTESYSKSSGGGNGIGGGAAIATTGQIPGYSRISQVEPSLSWELDLFGRIRSSVTEAKETLNARTADAASTRLSLGIDIANGVIDLRGCNYTAQVDGETVDSYKNTLNVVHRKNVAGFSSPVDESSAARDVATSGNTLATQQETCAEDMNALVALTGRDKAAIAALLAQPLPMVAGDETARFIPQPPQATPRLPATVLLRHPSIISADRDAAAAWAEIGVYKADRYPRIDLDAALTGEWLTFAGSTISSSGWSLGPTITGTLFDAGKAAANVDAAEARYRQSAANLQETVRTIVKEVENALARQHSASLRIQLSRQSVQAAAISLKGAEAQWKAGTNSLLDLEDARRQYATAQDNLINAAHDRTEAWTALVSATANSLTLSQSEPHGNNIEPAR